MKISHVDTSKAGYFKAEMDGKDIGLMTYNWADPHRINILSTRVDEAYRGQGIAKALVMEGVRFAREKQLKMTPMCSYVRYVFDRDPSLEDVQG